MPVNFYYDLCYLAFDFAEDYPKEAWRIHAKYVSFLSIAMWCFE